MLTLSLSPSLVQALLLNDILVLVSPTEDGSDKLHLKRYYKDKGSGIREEFSSIIRLKEMILRHFSIDKGALTHRPIRSALFFNFLCRRSVIFNSQQQSINDSTSNVRVLGRKCTGEKEMGGVNWKSNERNIK